MPLELTIHNGIEHDGPSGINLQEFFSLEDNTTKQNIVLAKQKASGLSQKQFGAIYGIAQSMVAKSENETQKIPADLVIKLSEV